MVENYSFWRGRKVFLTGHTGFKGSWLSMWLFLLGARTVGFSLDSQKRQKNFRSFDISEVVEQDVTGDICDFEHLVSCIQKFKPDIIIHMAAQSLVRDSYVDPLNTFNTNVMGTINVFEAVRTLGIKPVLLNVTSDKCYKNESSGSGYQENDPIGGSDPYSASKGCSEIITGSYYDSFFSKANIGVASVRAGNVIGGSDWSKNRLIPDAIKAFSNNVSLVLRNPSYVRPWQHVLDALSGYLILCERMSENPNYYSGAWNFGPNDASVVRVIEVAEKTVRQWGNGAVLEIKEDKELLESSMLLLNCAKAKAKLDWSAKWCLDDSIEKTVSWYKASFENENMLLFSENQINEYIRG